MANFSVGMAKKLWAHCRLLEELKDLMECSLGALQNRISISSDVCMKAKKSWRLGADKFTILSVALQHFGGLVVLHIHYVCVIFPKPNHENGCPSDLLTHGK